MYTAVPGRTGVVVAHITTSKKVEKKPVTKPVVTITKSYTSGIICSAKGADKPRIMRCGDDSPKGPGQLGKERRKCQRNHLRRRHADIYRSA